MTLDEYAKAQAAISADIARRVLAVKTAKRVFPKTNNGWLTFLRLVFPTIYKARMKSAELGRKFYDSERERHFPKEDRHDILLADYRQEWFFEDMFPAREQFLKPGAEDAAFEEAALRAVKVVENGGRRTIIRPITSEEAQDPVVKGWARVATGKETCGFCWMLVSRGPVYLSAASAGLDLGDTRAQQLIDQGDQAALAEATRRFHAGCDCLIVPVFKKSDWPGMEAWKRAEDLWKKVTKGYSGRDAMNAFRRAVERGEISPREVAAIAA
jgi:hypothetical protein